jgi:hypothetical protein
MNASGSRFEGNTPNGLNPQDGDPAVNAITDKIRREFDPRSSRSWRPSSAHDGQELLPRPYGPTTSLGLAYTGPSSAISGLHQRAGRQPRCGNHHQLVDRRHQAAAGKADAQVRVRAHTGPASPFPRHPDLSFELARLAQDSGLVCALLCGPLPARSAHGQMRVHRDSPDDAVRARLS